MGSTQGAARRRLAMAGFGSIGRVFWRCAQSDFGWGAGDAVVFEPDPAAAALAESLGLEVVRQALSEEGFRALLEPRLGPGTVFVNLAVDVCSADLAELCRAKGALYVDTGVDAWPPSGGAPQGSLARDRASLLSRLPKGGGHPTAVVGHGANPGLASHWAKAALEMLGRELGEWEGVPAGRAGWGRLSAACGVQMVQIAERDWTSFAEPPGVACNTWSVRGLEREAAMAGELGWGLHEGEAPPGAELESWEGGVSALLATPGRASWVRTWTPMGGPALGLAVTHLEALGLRALLASGSSAPTCLFAYQPCAAAAKWLAIQEAGGTRPPGLGWIPPGEDCEGVDELGALLMGARFGSLWLGSDLSSKQAREASPGASATQLQVAAGVCAAVGWALGNPAMGLLEPEDLPHDEVLARAGRWIGPPVWERSPEVEALAGVGRARAEPIRFGMFLPGRDGL